MPKGLIHGKIGMIIHKKEVGILAFGDNGPRKKSLFEKLTMVVVVLMIIITVGALVVGALSALR